MLYLFAVFLVHRITTCVLKWGISSFIMSKIQLCFRGKPVAGSLCFLCLNFIGNAFL